MSVETQAWWYAAVRVLAAAALGVLVGWLLGNVWAGLAATLALYLGWHLATLYRLDRWLRHRSIADPPDARGLWGEVIAQVVRLHRRKRYHKQRFVQLLRQIDRSTAALPDGVVILDAGREIVWFNRTAARLLHLRRADIGLRIDNLLRQPAFARYLELGRFESPVIIQPDARFLSIQAVPYGEGQLLLLVRDVSRQMRLEEVRKDFVANASHELRSPLTVIAGYLETLAQDPTLDPGLQGPIAEMRRQAERMMTLIRDLLELSRIEASEEHVEGEPIDVPAMLALLRKDVLERPRHPREIRVHIDSAVRLIGVESEIHSAFANLVDNAAKYTPEDGTIELRWWADEDGCHFSVTDTGIGIPAEHIPRLTERFYRVDPGRSRETGGSGLGLSIVNHVLQRHGATLEIESTPGRGSTFTCHFPPERIAAGREENTVGV
ncbi:MAG: phosphate regulon sensor histidine kinase PhoR [Pseudomonadota bacterium]|jgi:phosphate regulon sensor kinase PhoR|nr:MAG: phosphate regulon sensor histidine kinase PhoR [Pseudomonadota bacterium]